MFPDVQRLLWPGGSSSGLPCGERITKGNEKSEFTLRARTEIQLFAKGGGAVGAANW